MAPRSLGSPKNSSVLHYIFLRWEIVPHPCAYVGNHSDLYIIILLAAKLCFFGTNAVFCRFFFGDTLGSHMCHADICREKYILFSVNSSLLNVYLVLLLRLLLIFYQFYLQEYQET